MMTVDSPPVISIQRYHPDKSSFYAWIISNYQDQGDQVANEIVEIFTRDPDLEIPEDRIRMLAEESISNAIRHAYPTNDPRNTVLVFAYFEKGVADLVITDDGGGFDPSTVPDPTLPENIEKDGGRGLLLMDAFTKALNGDMEYINKFTRIGYNSGPNILRLRMRRPCTLETLTE